VAALPAGSTARPQTGRRNAGAYFVAQPLAFALEEGALERVIEQRTSEKTQRPQKDRSITVVVKESVATVLLSTLRSLATVNYGDRSHVTLLAQTVCRTHIGNHQFEVRSL
jgi:hypothetical protein